MGGEACVAGARHHRPQEHALVALSLIGEMAVRLAEDRNDLRHFQPERPVCGRQCRAMALGIVLPASVVWAQIWMRMPPSGAPSPARRTEPLIQKPPPPIRCTPVRRADNCWLPRASTVSAPAPALPSPGSGRETPALRRSRHRSREGCGGSADRRLHGGRLCHGVRSLGINVSGTCLRSLRARISLRKRPDNAPAKARSSAHSRVMGGPVSLDRSERRPRSEQCAIGQSRPSRAEPMIKPASPQTPWRRAPARSWELNART